MVVDLTEQGAATLLADRAPPRRLAGPAAAPSSPPTNAPSCARPPPSSTLSQNDWHTRSLSPTFRSLHNPNYRLYAAGGVVSNTGTWMQRVAQDWLVLQLTANGGAALGITTGLQFLPFLLLSPYAGLVADRFPKRRLLQITHVGMAVTGAGPGPARRHRHRPDLARLRAGVRVRHRLGLRRPGPADASSPRWSSPTT